MDSSLISGPTAGLADGRSVHPDPVPVRQAVATDLSSSQSVTATSDAAAGRNDAPRPAPSDQTTSQSVSIDPATRDLIFREIDLRNGQVIGQVPDAALLRAQVYAQAIANGETTNAAQSAADTDTEA